MMRYSGCRYPLRLKSGWEYRVDRDHNMTYLIIGRFAQLWTDNILCGNGTQLLQRRNSDWIMRYIVKYCCVPELIAA